MNNYTTSFSAEIIAALRRSEQQAMRSETTSHDDIKHQLGIDDQD
jgi:hypothetical protein